MKLYTLRSKQELPITTKEAWEFLSNPQNLKRITPEHMGFKIISDDDRPMYAGQIIQYKITPLLGIPITWVTEITQVSDQSFFVDDQKFGPYAYWHHKHFIKEIAGGIEMEDIIDYKMPFGFLGQLLHPLLVKPNLDRIFKYRQEKLAEIFGIYKEPS